MDVGSCEPSTVATRASAHELVSAYTSYGTPRATSRIAKAPSPVARARSRPRSPCERRGASDTTPTIPTPFTSSRRPSSVAAACSAMRSGATSGVVNCTGLDECPAAEISTETPPGATCTANRPDGSVRNAAISRNFGLLTKVASPLAWIPSPVSALITDPDTTTLLVKPTVHRGIEVDGSNRRLHGTYPGTRIAMLESAGCRATAVGPS